MRTACLLLALVVAMPAEARRNKKRGRAPADCPASCEARGLYAAKPPGASEADRAVLALCPAPPEDAIAHRDVRAFFEQHLADDRLARAAAAAAPHVKSKAERADWLASIWSGPGKKNAFTHVLCGDDWRRDKLGGIHLEARYAQLERDGKVCYGGPAGNRREPCRDGLCSIRFRGTRGLSCGEKPMGSFVQGLDAVDLLAAGTRAYAACCMGGGGERPDSRGRLRDGGRYRGPNDVTFQIWCGTRNGSPGISTFYPAGFGRATCGP